MFFGGKNLGWRMGRCSGYEQMERKIKNLIDTGRILLNIRMDIYKAMLRGITDNIGRELWKRR